MKPSYEELAKQLEQRETQLAETQRLLRIAIERITRLEEQINKNSKNSSKPPSADRKPNSSKKNKKPRKSRSGANRKPFAPEQIDHHVSCTLDSCPCCGSDQLVETGSPLILQQVELPEIKAAVTQFTRTKHQCKTCGISAFAELPNGVPNSAFGPRMMGLIATLTGSLHLAKRDAIQLIQDLFGVQICAGSVINVEERTAAALNQPYERIHHHVMQSALPKHFDETSWRDSGKGCYVWIASTRKATCLHINPRRSREAFETFVGSQGLSQAPVVTDRYSAYAYLENAHQYCLAHLIRDFRKYHERADPDGGIGKLLESELRRICKNHRLFRGRAISLRSRDARFRYQRRRLEEHLIDGLANGSDELSGLCERLLDRFHHLWVFSSFTDVDPTNNLAERDLRRIVLWRKKSYGTRSERGQRFVERISSISQSVKKAKGNVLAFIQRAIEAYYRGQSAPMIEPTLSF